MPRTMGARAGRSAATTGAASAVQSLHAYRSRLVAERANVDSRIAAIDNALRALGVAASRGMSAAPRAARAARVGRPRRGGRRGPRAGSLKEYILKVLSSNGGVMAVKDIAAGVLRAGYKTRNKTLAKSVGIALREIPDVRKVGRGKFRLK